MGAARLDCDTGVSERFFSQAFSSTSLQGTRCAVVRFLTVRRLLVREPAPDPFSSLLDRYKRHLSEVRGLSSATLEQHIATAKSLLAHALPADAPLQALSAAAVERFVITAARRIKRQTLQHVVARLRAFLRFCFDQGEVQERLDVIDAPRAYRGELPPRALAWPLVQRLLRSIDRSSRLGWRDYAILHLMAHYGLRPSEIITLTLGSIDWENKTLHVKQCKTRSDLILPVADQTLRILRHYLRRGRPGGKHPELFLRASTPVGPLTHYAIGDLYQKRAGQSGLPLQGTSSYCLRHSFAMRLLDRGVGVKVIGDLLGHHTLESTCVYLRLETGALREVALALPTATIGLEEDAR
ncbi:MULTISPECIES: tyrosine-type recombinase/integrase [Bradyrhizobium]|jgi:site-specific recombinase XerD|uniref:Site-specific recombinase XerD n=2 Tax=Nitrobacteraceae TaxID=41294 RepID=A0A8I1Y5H2_BRAEL|nr:MULTISPECIES: tyrosine-type recombinase/integrase [Bradyrhizobium]MBP1293635.1 site-specific recombinase XerD [Bradyrhizobium elkanii]MCP1925781.1 site-specific recombinase XerD [Bradyrhizobium elkanii]MCS3476727.1 site-specific recombinase XerD [Bradyrhizobium elkanii]MCS3566560.1 site-specific recombinase XerD [Bradyrhizobium elkanii]MCS3583465.1 site-specific recombinase XerD [Bradyrhizobium elkanii]